MKFIAIKGAFASATLALAILGTSIASAATVSYNQFVTGDDLGDGIQATLIYTQNGNDVDFALTNLLKNSPATAFISSIGFTYGGIIPTIVWNLSGTDANVTEIGDGNKLNVQGKGLSVDFAALFKGGKSNRLIVGETALFRIANVQTSLFDFSPLMSGIHGQGLTGDSTKYTTGDNDGGTGFIPVPLPASLPMLLSAFAGMAYWRKRKLKA